MKKTVAEQLAAMAADAGIRRAYGVTDTEDSLTTALPAEKRLRTVNVHHAEIAAFAAGAEAQLTGRPALCCACAAADGGRLINGLYDARRNGAPVLAVVSQVPTTLLGSAGVGETHPMHLYGGCTDYCETICRPAQAARVVSNALRRTVATPGVGMVVLPEDVAAMAADAEKAPLSMCAEGVCEPSAEAVAALAEKINAAARVAFFCGAGCRQAHDAVVALAQKVNAPVAYTLRAKDVMEKDNPNGVGMLGLLGWGDATHALHEAELVVMWGTDFPYPGVLPAHGRVVQVDRNAAVLGRRVGICLGIQGDVGRTAELLLPMIHDDRSDEFAARSLSRHGKALIRLQESMRNVDEEAALRPELITRLISDHAEPDAVFIPDSGPPVLWCARYLQALGSRRIIGSFNHGASACAIAMAIGAKAAYPSRQVIAFCTADGLNMLPAIARTLLSEPLSVKIFVYNHTGSENFAAQAQSVGITAARIAHAREANATVRNWLNTPGPALLEGMVAMPPAAPPDTSLLRALGFSRGTAAATAHRELEAVRRLLFGSSQTE